MSIHTIFLNFKFGTINQIVTAKPNQTDVVIRDGTNITFLKYNFHKEMQTHNELLQIRYHKFQWSWDSKWIIRSLSLQHSPAICIFCRCPGPILCIACHGIVASVWAAVFTPRVSLYHHFTCSTKFYSGGDFPTQQREGGQLASSQAGPVSVWGGCWWSPSDFDCHKFFSSSQGRNIGSVVGYSVFVFLRIVPSSLRSG